MTEITPTVGNWYKLVGGALFEVVAIDANEGSVEIQHFDGTVEEFDPENWDKLLLENAEPPEDWTGSFDMAPEDYFDITHDTPEHSWGSVLQFVEGTDL